ncbi:MAG: DUF5110 domain-containing protein [Defluviitaleaceae bacterium]|nr:DUF5110 domain-containing protein [Defluviitaleaceae bacterium]
MNTLKIDGVPVKVCFEALTCKTFRVAILPVEESVKDVFSTLDLDEDRQWNEPPIATHGGEGEAAYKIDGFTAIVNYKEFSIKIFKDNKHIQTLNICGKTGSVTFPLDKGRIFGLGHGYAKHFDRKGATYDLQVNGQVRGIMELYSATSPTPLVISTGGWALYFHQPWKSIINLEGEKGVFCKKPMEPLAYADIFVIDADKPETATQEYYKLTGMPPMLPKYAFGYQQSYRTLVHNGVNYVKKTAQYMRDNEIPCDMLIYLGTGYCDNGWNVFNGVFDWHPESFPEPEKTMQELHDMGYKINLHITRCYSGLHGKIGDADVSPMEYDHVKNYWKKHVKLYGQAKNECWWPDDADEVDMRARLARWRMYYEGSLQLNPDVRPFQMQRNTFPGANKWGGVIWTGDVDSKWETLKNQVPIGLNAALSSSPYWGTDTGGFYSDAEFDGELFIRWFQHSVFTPMMRGHGRSSFLRNPWGWTMFNSLDEIPLELTKNFWHDTKPLESIMPDTRVEPICRDMLNARYELLPYIYNLSYEATKGLPMLRPMWFKYPTDDIAAGLGDQYMFGDSLLVAPVTAKGAAGRGVYFPQGDFYCYWTGEKVQGGGYKDVEAGLDRIPVYAPAGGIIAKAPVVQYVDTAKKDDFDPLTIEIYTGKDGTYTLYEDDGISMGYTRGENTVTHFVWDDAKGELKAEGKSTMFPGKKREINVRLIPGREEFTVVATY